MEITRQDTGLTLEQLSEVNKSTLSSLNPDDLIYETVKLEDLPIYPDAWKRKYFQEIEYINTAISGQSGDPDGDGLINKLEYFYGANPKNSDTLCDGKQDGDKCKGLNDLQNVQADISPLTGLETGVPKTIRMKKQEKAILNSSQNSFETAAEEGLDFPTLYAKAKVLDLSSEFNAISVKTVDDNRQNFFDYVDFRVLILQKFSDTNELSTFAKIYDLSEPQDFEKGIKDFEKLISDMEKITPPKTYENSHKAYLMIFKNLLDLIYHRKTAVVDKKPIDEEFKAKTDRIGTRVVWSFNKLNQANSELPKIEN